MNLFSSIVSSREDLFVNLMSCLSSAFKQLYEGNSITVRISPFSNIIPIINGAIFALRLENAPPFKTMFYKKYDSDYARITILLDLVEDNEDIPDVKITSEWTMNGSVLYIQNNAYYDRISFHTEEVIFEFNNNPTGNFTELTQMIKKLVRESVKTWVDQVNKGNL